MFSTTCCFDSTSHAATNTAPTAPDGSTHSTTCSTVDPDRLEDQRREPEQHATAERNEHVVDDPLAGEADEVHPPLVRAERAAHVREGDREPEHDGQMGRDEDLGGRVRVVRVEVGHERDEHERRGRQHPSPGVEPAPAGEVPGEDRQHEQRDVSKQPGRLLVGEVRGEACDLDRGGRAQGEERAPPATCSTGAPARPRRSGRAASTGGPGARARTPATVCRGPPSASRPRGTPRRL